MPFATSARAHAAMRARAIAPTRDQRASSSARVANARARDAMTSIARRGDALETRGWGRDNGETTGRNATNALVANAVAVIVALTSAHGEAARAATAPGEGIGQIAGSLRAELVREERAVVDEVLKDEQIGLDVIRESKTAGEMLDLFIEKEPPLALFLVAMLLVNGSFGLVYTLFIRETSAGPGGEFGKGVVAVRQSIVKGIFAFFNSALGRYTTKDSQDA